MNGTFCISVGGTKSRIIIFCRGDNSLKMAAAKTWNRTGPCSGSRQILRRQRKTADGRLLEKEPLITITGLSSDQWKGCGYMQLFVYIAL